MVGLSDIHVSLFLSVLNSCSTCRWKLTWAPPLKTPALLRLRSAPISSIQMLCVLRRLTYFIKSSIPVIGWCCAVVVANYCFYHDFKSISPWWYKKIWLYNFSLCLFIHFFLSKQPLKIKVREEYLTDIGKTAGTCFIFPPSNLVSWNNYDVHQLCAQSPVNVSCGCWLHDCIN